MKDQILDFLREVDDFLAEIAKEDEVLDIVILGRSALILRWENLNLATKDVDIVQNQGLEHLEQAILAKFSKSDVQRQTSELYLEPVSSGLPPLANWFRSRSEEGPGNWKVIRPHILEIHDLAASKLKCFRKDREDLQLLCDNGLIESERLQASLQSAFAFVHEKDGDEDRESAFQNLDSVLQYLNGQIDTL